MTVDIICADAREALARFPDGHFHCCISSPPFWGLRDYGLEPTVWGGDGCEHEWEDEPTPQAILAEYQPRCESTGRFLAKSAPRAIVGRGDNGLTDIEGYAGPRAASQGAFCRRCNAWRGTLGLEPTPELYVEHLVGVMREVRRVLRPDATLWLNIGDSYGSGTRATRDYSHNTKHGYWQNPAIDKRIPAPAKQLLGMPWRVAFALQADGWWLRSDIIWSKPNPMPESVRDRPTRSHEYLFLLTKRERYYYDQDAIREPAMRAGDLPGGCYPSGAPEGTRGRIGAGWRGDKPVPAGRNKRSVWEIATQPFGLEMCAACRTIYSPAQYRRLRGGSMPRCTYEIAEDEPCGGTKWLAQDGGAMCLACETFYTAKQLERLPRAAKCRKCGCEEWLSHFATFPEKLVEPCILAGTSEWGCCPECGAPWERVSEKPQPPDEMRNRDDGTKMAYHSRQLGGGQKLQDWYDANPGSTIGWRPTCKHEAEPTPCRVLDCFSGSGTVGVVAERLGRHSVLIDAKEEYCLMARHRTAQRGLMVEAAT